MIKKIINSKIYDKQYFKMHSYGFNRMLNIMLPYINDVRGRKILDLGCGSGDLAIYLVKKGNMVVGIDYSADAINIANKKRRMLPISLRNNIKFVKQNAELLSVKNIKYDIIISVDVFEHLYKRQVIIVMKKIVKLLKPGGRLLIHTEANPYYLDFIHKYYTYPMDKLLIKINYIFTKKDYPGLPKESRNEIHKIQHVNEPTYFYLKKLLHEYGFTGEIVCRTLIKPNLSWKDIIYNAIVMLHPLSGLPPLKYLFAYDFICNMRKK